MTGWCCSRCGGSVEFLEVVDDETGQRLAAWDCLTCELRGWLGSVAADEVEV